MSGEVQSLVDGYWTWLKDKTTIRDAGEGWTEITTPYLDRHNDYLQIYARKEQGRYLLTDDGYVLDDLALSGCKIEGGKRETLLKTTLNGFGVQVNDRAIETRATPQTFALRKHNLVQAMLAVNDLFYLASPYTANLFYEDVVDWLDLCDIRYTPKVKFTGASGYDHSFDFVVPKSSAHPERLIRTVARPNRDMAQSMAFAWVDTRDARPNDSRAYVILNDQDASVPEAVSGALLSYDIRAVPWTRRQEAVPELAA